MRNFQCLLFVLKRSFICYPTICMTVPLRIKILIKHQVLSLISHVVSSPILDINLSNEKCYLR